MEKDRINFILNYSSQATKDDIFLLEKEIRKYPFSQVLHILLAKIQYDLHSDAKNKKLSTAAIYTSDRAVLKKVIQEKGYLDGHKKITAYQDLSVFIPEPEPEEKSIPTTDALKHESDNIFTEVLENLKKLKSLRKQFLFLEREEPESLPKQEPEAVKEKGSEKKIKKIDGPKSGQTKTGNVKAKKSESKQKKLDKIIEKDEILDSQVNTYFLNEIEKNEESIEQEKPKDIDQKKIIEKFIVEQPSIGSLKKTTEKSHDGINKDLSEKSTRFGDDLISENLAIILSKQGKKERSIDIYKKLIWKLPQKKAYFAARIEEIKK